MNWRLYCTPRVRVHYLESTLCPTVADWSLSDHLWLEPLGTLLSWRRRTCWSGTTPPGSSSRALSGSTWLSSFPWPTMAGLSGLSSYQASSLKQCVNDFYIPFWKCSINSFHQTSTYIFLTYYWLPSLHNCFRPPSLLVEGLVSTGPTPSSFYILVEMGLPLHLFPAYRWWELDKLFIKRNHIRCLKWTKLFLRPI